MGFPFRGLNQPPLTLCRPRQERRAPGGKQRPGPLAAEQRAGALVSAALHHLLVQVLGGWDCAECKEHCLHGERLRVQKLALLPACVSWRTCSLVNHSVLLSKGTAVVKIDKVTAPTRGLLRCGAHQALAEPGSDLGTVD